MKKLIYTLLLSLVLAGCGSGDGGQVTLACSDGFVQYAVPGTPINFCYDTAWGEPTVTKLGASQGELSRIAFAGGGEENSEPELFYESYDFAPIGGDTAPFCFSCIRITAPDEDIKTQVAEELGKNFNFSESDLNVRKSDVGGVRALRVHVKYTNKMGGEAADKIMYYVPSAYYNYNLTVSADNTQAAMLDDFVYDFDFAE